MTSASETIHRSTVLLVFNGQDEPLCRCCQTLSDGGIQVYYVPDVYSAMAQLAQGLAPSHVVVDIRLLDNFEMGFLSIAPHYYPNTEILVPLLEGTAERAAHQNGHIDMVALQDLADGILGIRRAVTASSEADEVVEWAGQDVDDPAMPAASIDAESVARTQAASQGQREPHAVDSEQSAFEVPTRTNALSTDGGAESTEAGLSLHEIVRQRMAGRQPSRLPRRPPQFASPSESSSPPSSAVSPEELEALLREGDETEESRVDLPPGERAGGGAP
jgi:hypothetical protein